MNYLEARCRHVDQKGKQLQPLYSIHGDEEIPELVLDHLEGYMGKHSVPTRISLIYIHRLLISFSPNSLPSGPYR